MFILIKFKKSLAIQKSKTTTSLTPILTTSVTPKSTTSVTLTDEKLGLTFYLPIVKKFLILFWVYIVYNTLANGTVVFTGIFGKIDSTASGYLGYCLKVYDFHFFDKILL